VRTNNDSEKLRTIRAIYDEDFKVTTVFAASSLSSLELSDTAVYEPSIRARLGTTSHFCKVVLILRKVVLD
jgi:hypothetical protein